MFRTSVRAIEQLEPRALLAAFVVDSVGDESDANPGDGSALTSGGLSTFRAALEELNALGDSSSTINFSIAGSITIRPESQLPVIAEQVEIDGRNQVDGRLIEIDGSLAGDKSGIVIGDIVNDTDADGSCVEYLVVNRFQRHGFVIADPFVDIEYNIIGTDVNRSEGLGNGRNGIRIVSNDVDIYGNTVANNGFSPSGNDAPYSGIFVANVDNLGGLVDDLLIEDNTVSGNARHGIRLFAAGRNGVYYNDVFGNAQRGISVEFLQGGQNSISDNQVSFNTGDGIVIDGGFDDIVSSNDVWSNGGSGILVLPNGSSSGRVEISQNSIYSNTGLGIELEEYGVRGVTTNDVGDIDTSDDGGNNLQNFPVIESIQRTGGNNGAEIRVTGRLESAIGEYRIEFFANAVVDPSGNGEGRNYLGSVDVEITSGSQVSFDVNLNPNIFAKFATATAGLRVFDTSLADWETSEFSAAVAIPPPPAADSIGLYNPASATFFLRNTNDSGVADVPAFNYGIANWIPLVGDWNGDGTNSIGAYNPGTATFFLRNANNSGDADVSPFNYGIANWVPLAGDWDGDGTDSIGVYNPDTATFFLRNTNDSGVADISAFNYGIVNWVPVVGDWNNDGTDTIGVYNSDSATFFLRNSNDSGVADVPAFNFGIPGWVPIAGDWNDDGTDSIGAFNSDTATFFLRNSNDSGVADIPAFNYGIPGWIPLAGDWDSSNSNDFAARDLSFAAFDQAKVPLLQETDDEDLSALLEDPGRAIYEDSLEGDFTEPSVLPTTSVGQWWLEKPAGNDLAVELYGLVESLAVDLLERSIRYPL
ncbi:MAG: right-handed parallel beta-helix repeat-containing protein [Pirellulales bacterium]